MRDEFVRAIADMEEDEALRLAEAWLASGADPNDLPLDGLLREGRQSVATPVRG